MNRLTPSRAAVARRVHCPEVGGSTPPSATISRGAATISRRTLFGRSLWALPAVILGCGTLKDESDVLRIRVTRDRDDWVASHCRAFNADTGEDISHRIPHKYAERLRRSWRDKRAVKIALYELNAEGQVYVSGDRLAKVARRVRVVDVVRSTEVS